MSDEWNVRQALYRAAATAPGFKLLLDSAVAIYGDDAVATSMLVELGGDVREPTLIRRVPVRDRLHRGVDGHWTAAMRQPAGTGLDLAPGTLVAGRGLAGVLTEPPNAGSDRAMLAEVLDLLARYGRCADGDPTGDGWRDCFVEDGVVSTYSPRADRPPVIVRGREVIERAFASAPRPATTVHLVGDVVIGHDLAPRADSEHAVTIDSRFIRLDRVGRDTLVGSFGRYDDRAVRCSDGFWRLTRREIHLFGRRPPAQAG